MAEEINYGQADITAFTQRAGAGEFSFEPDAARAAVQEIGIYISGLRTSRLEIAAGEQASGFGTLPSGTELQQGFRNKARSAGDAIDQLIQGAMQIQEGFLRAAGLIEDADDLNARRIALAANATEGQ
ncbi:hypothetical protein ACFVAV_34085 [Nocardia sp. NPDC057663]|uniref:hypothetical protein n=1 Tax=Nocardia sp. NPDC057663 TaxID=3346201 RepID=UPI003671457A